MLTPKFLLRVGFCYNSDLVAVEPTDPPQLPGLRDFQPSTLFVVIHCHSLRGCFPKLFERPPTSAAHPLSRATVVANGHASPRAIWRAPSRVWWPRLRPSTM